MEHQIVATVEIPSHKDGGPTPDEMQIFVRNAIGNLLDEHYDGAVDAYRVLVDAPTEIS